MASSGNAAASCAAHGAAASASRDSFSLGIYFFFIARWAPGQQRLVFCFPSLFSTRWLMYSI
jgi:hypothetical protein